MCDGAAWKGRVANLVIHCLHIICVMVLVGRVAMGLVACNILLCCLLTQVLSLLALDCEFDCEPSHCLSGFFPHPPPSLPERLFSDGILSCLCTPVQLGVKGLVAFTTAGWPRFVAEDSIGMPLRYMYIFIEGIKLNRVEWDRSRIVKMFFVLFLFPPVDV